MCEIHEKKVEMFCENNGFDPPKVEVKDCGDGQLMATLIVDTGGIALARSAIGSSESEAKCKVYERFVNTIVEKPKQKWFEGNDNMAQNEVHNENQSSSTTQSPDKTKQDKATVPLNIVGKLNEMCQKRSYAFPSYNVLKQSGEAHNPVFEMQCTLKITNGQTIIGIGIGCPKQEAKKRSAQEVITKLEDFEANGMKANTGAELNLNSYFNNNFLDIKQLDLIIEDKDLDSWERLERMAVLINCRIEVQSSENCNQVILRLIINDSDYPLITAFGDSAEGVDISRRIAANKAVKIIKDQYTNEEN